MAPAKLADRVPGCSGTRNLSDNISDLRAQVGRRQLLAGGWRGGSSAGSWQGAEACQNRACLWFARGVLSCHISWLHGDKQPNLCRSESPLAWSLQQAPTTTATAAAAAAAAAPQVAANTKGISLVKELIAEYSLGVVQAYMAFIQANAEQAVRQMLVDFSKQQVGRGGVPRQQLLLGPHGAAASCMQYVRTAIIEGGAP